MLKYIKTLTAASIWSRAVTSSARICTEESSLTVIEPLLTKNIVSMHFKLTNRPMLIV